MGRIDQSQKWIVSFKSKPAKTFGRNDGPTDIIHNAIVDMKLFHETLTPQTFSTTTRRSLKRLQMAGYEIVPEAKMAANTFTIELSDQDKKTH